MASLKTWVFLLQFLLYSVVGAICCLIDVTTFLLIASYTSPILATTLSFTLATLVNYYLSVKFIFQSSNSFYQQLTRTFLVASIGLIFNTIGFILLYQSTSLPPIWIKLSVIPAVLFWNFLGRRIFAFSAEIPLTTLVMLSRLFKK